MAAVSRSGELTKNATMAAVRDATSAAGAKPTAAEAVAAVREAAANAVHHEGWMVRYGRRKIGRSFFHTRYFVLESMLLAYYHADRKDSMVRHHGHCSSSAAAARAHAHAGARALHRRAAAALPAHVLSRALSQLAGIEEDWVHECPVT